MNIPTNYKIINSHQGKPEFVLVPFDDYLKLTQTSKINFDDAVPSEVVNLMLDKGYLPARAWREYLGLTQAEAAENLDISQSASAYSQFKAAEHPRKKTRIKIAKALGINPEQLDCYPD